MPTVRKFNACTPRPKYNQDGVWWHRVGRATENEKGQISIFFDSVPVPGEKGEVRVVLFVDEGEREENTEGARRTASRGAKPAQRGGGRRGDLDDEIPF